MRFKLDENLGQRGAELLRQAGHDVATVEEEGLSSAADRQVLAQCVQEQRCLITLDMDFGNPLVFDPRQHAGIVVLRLPHRPGPEHLQESIRNVVRAVASEPLVGRLWIVQGGRIRVYQPDLDDDSAAP